MKKLMTALLSIVIVPLIGCNPIATVFRHTTTSPQPTASTTAWLTPTYTETPEPTAAFRRACAPIETAIPSGFRLEGTVILMGPGDPNPLYSFSAGDESPRDFTYTPDWFTISPDRKWIVEDIRVGSDDQLTEIRFLSLDGQVEKTIPVDPPWRDSEWLGENLNLVRFIEATRSYVYLNVATGQTTEIDPSIYEHTAFVSSPSLDPGLTRVVFQQVKNGAYSLVLREMQNNQELWKIATAQGFADTQWSLDGSQFAAAVPIRFDPDSRYQLMIVDRDGNVRQTQVYTPSRSMPLPVLKEIRRPQWSPDQRHILFWYGDLLIVFDTETGISTDYCLSSYDPPYEAAVWSPDSRQIAFDMQDEPDHDSLRVVVLDIESGKAVQIASGLFVLGWMTTSP